MIPSVWLNRRRIDTVKRELCVDRKAGESNLETKMIKTEEEEEEKKKGLKQDDD